MHIIDLYGNWTKFNSDQGNYYLLRFKKKKFYVNFSTAYESLPDDCTEKTFGSSLPYLRIQVARSGIFKGDPGRRYRCISQKGGQSSEVNQRSWGEKVKKKKEKHTD